MTATYDWLCATLIKEYKVQPERLTPEVLLDDLGIDSLGTAELLFNVEDEFGIVLPQEPVQLPTLADVVRFIDGLILAQTGQGDPAKPAGAPDSPACADSGAIQGPPAP